MPAPGRDVAAGELELKALVLMAVYTGDPKVLHQATMMCHHLGLQDALLQVGQMSAEERATPHAQRLVVQGRTFLTCWVATHFYTISQSEFCQQNGFTVSTEVVRHQLDVLEQSEFKLLPCDHMLRVNIEENFILRDVYEQIGPSLRIRPIEFDEVCDGVEAAVVLLRRWAEKWSDAMTLVTTWGDGDNVKAAIPLHHALLNVSAYLFGRNARWDKLQPDARTRELARLGREAALAMLRWGVESRIWLPHSMIAVYHTFINIPTSLTVLSNVSRLFPADSPLRTIRTLLHRVLEQSNACIAAGVAPQHEMERARETKLQVLEFDRWAFEQGEDEADVGSASGADKEAESNGSAGGGAGAGGAEGARSRQAEEESIVEDMSANLGALKLDLALWGSMLMEGPDN